MVNLMLSVMRTFAEFERSLIRECHGEGIALVRQRGANKGRKKPQVRTSCRNWSSAPAAVFRKQSLPLATGSVGTRFTSTCATFN